MVKALLGYDIEPGVTVDEYERWIRDVHIPDLLANPHLKRIVFNTIIRPVTQTSAGTQTVEEPETFYRIAELHFDDEHGFEAYQQWFRDHPIPPERGPAGRTAFRFYLLADSWEVSLECGQPGASQEVTLG